MRPALQEDPVGHVHRVVLVDRVLPVGQVPQPDLVDPEGQAHPVRRTHRVGPVAPVPQVDLEARIRHVGLADLEGQARPVN